MSEKDYAPLSIACVRGLCDKIYDKRKFAGAEIEKMVKDFSDANNTSQIKRLIRVLGQDLMASSNPNVKNGALMGLSSVAVGLGKGCVVYLPELTQPIMACLSESESRVRYQATEALFNVLKITRGASSDLFPAVFDALARLVADPEPQVRQGAELLDRLVKDIVTEAPGVELGAVVALVRERMYARHAAVRQFVASWLAVLDAVPALDLRPHLPRLLDGLLLMLDDDHHEIRRMVDVQLGEFLRSIKQSPARVDFQAMINILIMHAQSPEELIQLTAITWIKEFVQLAGATMLPYASGILCAALPCLAYCDEPKKNIRETAATVNMLLMKLVVSEEESRAQEEGVKENEAKGEVERESAKSEEEDVKSEEEGVQVEREGRTSDGEGAGVGGGEDDGRGAGRLQLDAVVNVLTQQLHHSSVHTRAAALDWMLHLYNKLPGQMFYQTEKLFVSVVGSLTDASDDVVRRSLAVLAEICESRAPGERPGDLESSPYYYKFLRALLRLLAADENLLEDRGAFIIRQLCVLLNAEHIYRALAAILAAERDLRFASTAVHVLGTLLLTAAELYDLRLQLRAFAKPSTHELFVQLYGCWCHSPVALLALCLLTHNYRHCNALINTFGDLEITVDFLTEVDKLVQLIESPIFAYLRLELLGGQAGEAGEAGEAEGSSQLRGALYGLLMLLPQSDAFHTLRRRLHCAPAQPLALECRGRAAGAAGAAARVKPDIDFEQLLQQFIAVQAKHREYKLLDRTKLLAEPYS